MDPQKDQREIRMHIHEYPIIVDSAEAKNSNKINFTGYGAHSLSPSEEALRQIILAKNEKNVKRKQRKKSVRKTQK